MVRYALLFFVVQADIDGFCEPNADLTQAEVGYGDFYLMLVLKKGLSHQSRRYRSAGQSSKHFEFWQNPKEGYDFFEERGNIPPNVLVRGRGNTF